MESPLNSAHILSRKADKFLNLSKYDEAIECHQKAADLLDQAMSLSSSSSAQESLRLQRNDHIRQQKLIQSKQSYSQHMGSKDSVTLSPSNGVNGGNMDSTNDMSEFSFMDDVQQNMVETNSLLQFLEGRCMSAETAYIPPKKDTSDSHGEVNASKIPVDDKLIIEELSLHNKELRKHILVLLNDLEKSQQENTKLRFRNQQLANKDSLSGDNSQVVKESVDVEKYLTLDLDDIDNLDLPPLEMPTFDFNSVQQKVDDLELKDDNHAVS